MDIECHDPVGVFDDNEIGERVVEKPCALACGIQHFDLAIQPVVAEACVAVLGIGGRHGSGANRVAAERGLVLCLLRDIAHGVVDIRRGVAHRVHRERETVVRVVVEGGGAVPGVGRRHRFRTGRVAGERGLVLRLLRDVAYGVVDVARGMAQRINLERQAVVAVEVGGGDTVRDTDNRGVQGLLREVADSVVAIVRHITHRVHRAREAIVGVEQGGCDAVFGVGGRRGFHRQIHRQAEGRGVLRLLRDIAHGVVDVSRGVSQRVHREPDAVVRVEVGTAAAVVGTVHGHGLHRQTHRQAEGRGVLRLLGDIAHGVVDVACGIAQRIDRQRQATVRIVVGAARPVLGTGHRRRGLHRRVHRQAEGRGVARLPRDVARCVIGEGRGVTERIHRERQAIVRVEVRDGPVAVGVFHHRAVAVGVVAVARHTAQRIGHRADAVQRVMAHPHRAIERGIRHRYRLARRVDGHRQRGAVLRLSRDVPVRVVDVRRGVAQRVYRQGEFVVGVVVRRGLAAVGIFNDRTVAVGVVAVACDPAQRVGDRGYTVVGVVAVGGGAAVLVGGPYERVVRVVDVGLDAACSVRLLRDVAVRVVAESLHARLARTVRRARDRGGGTEGVIAVGGLHAERIGLGDHLVGAVVGVARDAAVLVLHRQHVARGVVGAAHGAAEGIRHQHRAVQRVEGRGGGVAARVRYRGLVVDAVEAGGSAVA